MSVRSTVLLFSVQVFCWFFRVASLPSLLVCFVHVLRRMRLRFLVCPSFLYFRFFPRSAFRLSVLVGLSFASSSTFWLPSSSSRPLACGDGYLVPFSPGPLFSLCIVSAFLLSCSAILFLSVSFFRPAAVFAPCLSCLMCSSLFCCCGRASCRSYACFFFFVFVFFSVLLWWFCGVLVFFFVLLFVLLCLCCFSSLTFVLLFWLGVLFLFCVFLVFRVCPCFCLVLFLFFWCYVFKLCEGFVVLCCVGWCECVCWLLLCVCVGLFFVFGVRLSVFCRLSFFVFLSCSFLSLCSVGQAKESRPRSFRLLPCANSLRPGFTNLLCGPTMSSFSLAYLALAVLAQQGEGAPPRKRNPLSQYWVR